MTVLPWVYPKGIYAQLEVAPTDEPLTVAEAKLRAGLDWPAEDAREALMADYITAARQQVEQDTSLALLTQTWLVTITAAGIRGLVPQTTPTQSISEVEPGQVRVVSGWPSPALLRTEAPLLVEAVGLLAAHYATFGRDVVISGIVARVPAGYEEAIAPYRLIWVT